MNSPTSQPDAATAEARHADGRSRLPFSITCLVCHRTWETAVIAHAIVSGHWRICRGPQPSPKGPPETIIM